MDLKKFETILKKLNKKLAKEKKKSIKKMIFICPDCGKKLKVEVGYLGSLVCNKCGFFFGIVNVKAENCVLFALPTTDDF